jgi:hypothetical protein
MASQKLVRCEIRKPGSTGEATVRFVPLEIFGLWEFLMRNKHRFEVTRSVASLWFDVDETPEVAYGENQYERVTEVQLVRYSSQDGMFSRVSRYFPTPEYPILKEMLLRHYESVSDPSAPHLQLKEREGIWIRRNPRA